MGDRPARRLTPGRHLECFMNENETSLAALRGRPLAFLFRYVRLHPIGHAVVLASVLLAVLCSVSSQ